MNQIHQHLDKDNLHHAYLTEGARSEIVPEIKKFCENLGIKTSGNPDFCHIVIDNFKIEEAFDLRAMSTDKSFSSTKKIFIICLNSISLDAQNVLLKMFEEPIENTHFFLVVPDANALLKTLVSRFYLIPRKTVFGEEIKDAEKFIAMSLRNRIDFMKELLLESEEEDEEGNEIITLDSTRSKALKFLNALETVLHQKIFNSNKMLKNSAVFTLPGVPGGFYADQNFLASCFEQILKVREFLRMPGSSTKNLMESVALVIPEKV
ncbi:MAG: hypothetical protein AAB661_02340 [Patescibacteria group bacterium]